MEKIIDLSNLIDYNIKLINIYFIKIIIKKKNILNFFYKIKINILKIK